MEYVFESRIQNNEFEVRGFPILSCAFCGFEGVMSSTSRCWEDGATMVRCPVCQVVVCVNSEEIELKQKRKVVRGKVVSTRKIVRFNKWRESEDILSRMLDVLAKR